MAVTILETERVEDVFVKVQESEVEATDIRQAMDGDSRGQQALRNRAEVMLARGTADAFALRERFHNPVTDARYAPPGETARAIFDALESTRCEAIGARAMNGVADNLDARLADESDRRGYAAMRETSEAPMHEAAGFLLRQKLTGRPLPAAAQNVLDIWQDFFDGQHESDPKALGDNIEKFEKQYEDKG